MNIEKNKLDELKKILDTDKYNEVVSILSEDNETDFDIASSDDFYANLIAGHSIPTHTKPLSGYIAPFIISFTKDFDDESIEVVSEAFLRKGHIVRLDRQTICVLYDCEESGESVLSELANDIYTILTEEMLSSVSIAFSRAVSSYGEVHAAFLEAKSALDISRRYYFTHNIYSYTDTTIIRLIEELPPSVKEKYIESFKNRIDFETIDKETLSIIDSFCKNNLHLAETARECFLHRNTLVYRLDKFYKDTGIDVRTLNGATTYLLAKMLFITQ